MKGKNVLPGLVLLLVTTMMAAQDSIHGRRPAPPSAS